jgi:hypothetical protein
MGRGSSLSRSCASAGGEPQGDRFSIDLPLSIENRLHTVFAGGDCSCAPCEASAFQAFERSCPARMCARREDVFFSAVVDNNKFLLWSCHVTLLQPPAFS